MKRSKALIPAAILSLAALSGCVDGGKTYESVASDPTPNLQTLYQRPIDVNNALTVTSNEDFRMFWEDLGRVFYVDRPSYLTREIIPAHKQEVPASAFNMNAHTPPVFDTGGVLFAASHGDSCIRLA